MNAPLDLPEIPRGNDDLGTPERYLELVYRVLGCPVDLDPCSNPWSLVKANVSLSLHNGEDGLSAPWYLYGNTFFVNPPYSYPFPWSTRTVEAWRDGGMSGIWLGRLDPSTGSNRILRDHRIAQCDVTHRIKFEGGKYNSGSIASTFIYFGHDPDIFRSVFSTIGDVHS